MFARRRFVTALSIAALLLMLTAAVASAQFRPSVRAIPQDVVDGIVNVAAVSIDAPGFVVVTNAAGDVLGSAPVDAGISATIPVEIDASGVADGDTLTISLYSDDGDGAFDAAVDTPVELNGAPVSTEITANAVGNSLLSTVLGASDLSALAGAVESAGLAGELGADGGPYTVFAPSDAAFAATTLPADAEAQATLLLGHVVPGIFTTDVLTESQELATLAGTTLDVQVGDDGTITVNGANIVTPDVVAYNGVAHVIDAVLLPEVAEEVVAEEPAVEAAAVVTDTAVVTETAVLTETAAVTTTEAVATAAPTEEPTEEATPAPTEEATEEAVATEAPAEEATEAPAEEATAAPAEEAAATEVPAEEATAVPAEEATAAPAEEAAATEAPAEEATAVPAEEATAAPAEEAAATPVPAEEAPETLPATGAPAASPITLMLVAGLVLVALAIFAVAFRRRAA